VNNQGKTILEGSVSDLQGKFSFDNPISPGVYVVRYFANGNDLLARVIVK
jgi:hypothetical protein